MNFQQANFEDLHNFYFEDSVASVAAGVLVSNIRKEQNVYLSNILRDYRETPITSEHEINLRAGVDALIICYDVLEIAAMVDFISPPDDSGFWKDSKAILANNQVRNYYTSLYPVKLPQLLLNRLQGQPITVGNQSADSTTMFLTFIELDRWFMENLNDRYLLRMLDSFTINGYRFSDIVELIQQKEEFIHRILEPDKDDVCDKVLQEFSVFIEFCFNLHRLLNRAQKYPVLMSAIWNHYSYWFAIIGEEMKHQLGEALDKFLLWEPPGDKQHVAEVRIYVEQAKTIIKDLTSSQYSAPIDNISTSAGN